MTRPRVAAPTPVTYRAVTPVLGEFPRGNPPESRSATRAADNSGRLPRGNRRTERLSARQPTEVAAERTEVAV